MENLNIHKENAFSAFRKAVQFAEESLRRSKAESSNSIEEAHALLDLAELHICTLESTKSEIEFRQALDIFYQNTVEGNEIVRTKYIAYILKALSGIYSCQGRKKEAEEAMKNGLIWEEKIICQSARKMD